jgi:glucose-6-phosphate isomerase
MKESTYEKRFFNGYRMFDDKSGFLLNYAGVAGFDREKAKKKYHKSLEAALKFMKRVEAQEVVNVSEGRKVDHFNLRLGEGLTKSISYFNKIKEAVEDIKSGKTINENNQSYTDVIMNGIGGSYLGPLMILLAKLGYDFNVDDALPVKIHFLNNTDSDSFYNVMSKVDISRTIMVNISKSGSTAETAGTMEAFNKLLEAASLPIGKHNITVTTPGSPFDKFSQENNYLHIFYMNTETGGRTSVGSAVGMVPAAFGGLDFEQFLKGESYMDELTRRETLEKNPALIIALIINDAISRAGHQNQIVLGYSDSLRETAHYFQQLFMESLGKNKDMEDKKDIEPTGLTIFGGVGTGEQHAFMQQVQKGIRDAFCHFISFRTRTHDYDNKKAGSMGRQLLAFVEGTQKALRSNEREYISMVFEEQNEFNMGMIVALHERVVVFLAGMWGINPFDQPGVQDGKHSADSHNALSKQIEAKLAETPSFKGNAEDMAELVGLKKEEAPGIESILNDIEANHNVEGAYPTLINFSVTRKWDGKKFIYDIRHN